MEEPQSAYEKDTSDCVPNKNKRNIRGKEKICYVDNPDQRKVTLSRRKTTLFKNAFKLHVMTKAEVFLIIQPSKQHRIVWGSPSLKTDYESGKLKPIVGQQFLSPEEIDGQNGEPAVEAMTETPERRNNMSPSLANVLGHTPTNHHQITPTEGTRIPELQSVPAPVREILLRRPRARLHFDERPTIITEQTEITFISDQNVALNVHE